MLDVQRYKGNVSWVLSSPRSQSLVGARWGKRFQVVQTQGDDRGPSWPVMTVTPEWPSPPDVLPVTRCQFTLTPPRHFLYPSVLLLLAEDPRHGYLLVEGLEGLGLGKIDRATIYRVLNELKSDGLIHSWDEPPVAGSTRHVYAITTKGSQVLEGWMSVVAQERSCLDLVLQRYWYCNAQRIADEAGQLKSSDTAEPDRPRDCGPTLGAPSEPAMLTPRSSRVEPPPGPGGSASISEMPTQAPQHRVSFAVSSRRSSLVVEARSNIGPIAFTTRALKGEVEVEISEGVIAVDPAPLAHLEARVAELSSGNSLYDSELLRRLDVRRFPKVQVVLTSVRRIGEGNCYVVGGDVTMHGVTRTLEGAITATVTMGKPRRMGENRPSEIHLNVTGEHVMDIRHFGMEVPSMPLFKIYPDVRLHLHLEADAVEYVA